MHHPHHAMPFCHFMSILQAHHSKKSGLSDVVPPVLDETEVWKMRQRPGIAVSSKSRLVYLSSLKFNSFLQVAIDGDDLDIVWNENIIDAQIVNAQVLPFPDNSREGTIEVAVSLASPCSRIDMCSASFYIVTRDCSSGIQPIPEHYLSVTYGRVTLAKLPVSSEVCRRLFFCMVGRTAISFTPYLYLFIARS